MKKVILLLAAYIIMFIIPSGFFKTYSKENTWWEVQSIDTVKYSRDLSREKAGDPKFLDVIDQQVKAIAAVGATHVGIGTPYDKEFIPMLTNWVKAARKYNLHVWFRGNFSGWEHWFNYPRITRSEHAQLTKDFIYENRELFVDGDIFTACPECENGGPGDPRTTEDVQGHRDFLIEEYQITTDAFRKIGKNVRSNFVSMNADVARVIYDEKTTRALGGVVSIDHYVKTPEQLVKDIKALAKSSKGRVVLGEFGAPIPDIHGSMTEEMQRAWLYNAFELLIDVPELIGVNYWVNVGGYTALWSETGDARSAVEVLNYYYNPGVLRGSVTNELGQPVEFAKVFLRTKEISTNKLGEFAISYYDDNSTVKIVSSEYLEYEKPAAELLDNSTIVLLKKDPGLLFRIKRFLYNILN